MTEVRIPIENAPSRIENVNNRLKVFTPDIVGRLLDAKSQVDPKAGIIIVPLDGEVRSAAGQDYHFHGARVLTSSPETPNFVNPHFHKIGEEPYRVLAGDNGEMNIGVVQDGQVEWREPRKVVAGDDIEVQEGEVHSLRNIGETPLDFAFACPDEHLVDNGPDKPEGDRYFTKDLPNGIPPWYPK